MPAIAHENKILGNINTLNGLTDVDLTSPQDGQVLTSGTIIRFDATYIIN